MSTETESTDLAVPKTEELEALTASIRQDIEAADKHWQNAVTHAIRAGDGLIEAKGKLKHGQWLPWLEENLEGFSPRSAARYMRLAKNRHTVAHLPTVNQAVALLTQPQPKTGIPFSTGTEAEALEDLQVARAHGIRDAVVTINAELRRQIRAGGKVQAQVDQLAQGEVAVALLEVAFELTEVPPRPLDQHRVVFAA